MDSHNEQNSYLCGLIYLVPVQQGIRFENENGNHVVPICAKDFIPFHGIGRGKSVYFQKSLKITGNSHKDSRGKKSGNEENLMEICVLLWVVHYSLVDSKKLYLPEELNIIPFFRVNIQNKVFSMRHIETFSILNSTFLLIIQE